MKRISYLQDCYAQEIGIIGSTNLYSTFEELTPEYFYLCLVVSIDA